MLAMVEAGFMGRPTTAGTDGGGALYALYGPQYSAKG